MCMCYTKSIASYLMAPTGHVGKFQATPSSVIPCFAKLLQDGEFHENFKLMIKKPRYSETLKISYAQNDIHNFVAAVNEGFPL